jgi:hypothetical protein
MRNFDYLGGKTGFSFLRELVISCPDLWDLVTMGRLSKLIVVNKLRCSKYKRNSAEFLMKKNLPSNKKDMLGSFNIEQVVQSDCYSWYQSPGMGSGKNSKEVVDIH